ncbi:hypothetical protein [Brevundimonas sp.]|uniref:hypothetical protein n=1 Tax=Brevundimonas sp. TaxID=1871086 RepID=UPI003BAB5C75
MAFSVERTKARDPRYVRLIRIHADSRAATLETVTSFCHPFACREQGISQMAHTTPKQVLESLAKDIAAVLKSMGGSAHQNMVVDCIAAMKRQRGEAVIRPTCATRSSKPSNNIATGSCVRSARVRNAGRWPATSPDITALNAKGALLAERAFVVSADPRDQKRRM